MFARGRPCLKRCGLSAVLDHAAAAPEEPLLFLYPHWFTSMVRQQRRTISAITPATLYRAPTHTLNRPLPRPRGGPRPTRNSSFGASSRRWISGGPTPVRTVTDEYRNPVQQDEDSTTNAAGDNSEPKETGKSVQRGATVGESGIPGSQSLWDAIDDDDAGLASLQTSPSSTARESPALRRQRTAGRARATIQLLSVRDRRKLRNRLYWTKHTPGFAKTEWWGHGVREMLEILQRGAWLGEPRRKEFVEGEETNQKEILIPEETVALLAGVSKWTMEENIWYVPVRNGCKVHVLRPIESEGQSRKAILSGTDWAIGLVSDRIQRAYELQKQGSPLIDVRKPVVPVFPSLRALELKKISPPLVRGVWDFHSSRRRARLDMILRSTKELKTVREFTEHVEDIVNSLPSGRRTSRQLPESHQKVVATALYSLFMQEKNKYSISTASLNTAISYLLHHWFKSYAYRLVVRAGNMATIDTYNILLKSAAMNQDLRAFRRILRMMSGMRFRPNAHTWLAYLDCLTAPRAKQGLVKYMENHGYLQEPSVMRGALQLTIQDSFLEHLGRGGTVDTFINDMAGRTQTNWFSPSLLGQLFSVTMRLKDIPAMNRLLEICRQHELDIHGSRGLVLLQIALLFREDMFALLPYLFRCIHDPNPKLDAEVWERLFIIAFKGRHYNMSRVLWRYACMNGVVTVRMREAVTFSLFQNIGKGDESQLETLWRTSAGKVIAGLDLHLPDYPVRDDIVKEIPPEFHQHPLSFFNPGAKISGEARHKQVRLARTIARRDMAVGPLYRPVYPLATMLEAAAVIDQEWQGVPRPMKWLMQNAIQIPLQISDSRK